MFKVTAITIGISLSEFGHLFIQPTDYSKSFQFFTDVLGWEVEKSIGQMSEASRLSYLKSKDGFSLVLAEDHDPIDLSKKPKVYNERGRLVIYFETPDVDRSFLQIKDGAHVVLRPEDNHWGTRWFLVEDPHGHQFAWQGPKRH